MPVQMKLSRIIISEINEQQVIYLKEVDGDRQFPILIGFFEATSIDRRVRGKRAPRPLTHDLVVNLVESLGGELDSVVIRDQGSNPPGGAIGTVTLTGAGTVEAQASGTYLHTVIYDYGECVPNCSYYVDVSSTRTNHTATSSNNLVRIKKCTASKPPGNIAVKSGAPPN